MKEKEFLNYISTIDTDYSMDQKVLKQVFDYDEATNTNKNILNNKIQLMLSLPKIAAALIIITIVGTATAFASGYLVKVFPLKITYTESEEIPIEYTLVNKTHIKGSEILTNEYGTPLGYKRIPDAAEEAFALFDLPNLVPTYLLENYYTDSEGYVYTESLADDGNTFKMLRAFFVKDLFVTDLLDLKEVFLWFYPVEHSVKDIVFNYSNLPSRNITHTTYITKSGLPCVIKDHNIDNHYLEASILFDSDILGNGYYRLEFSPNIEMEEVEAILESIPLNSNGELIDNWL